ncbi:hypothetical protein AJ78_00269 [Emergomyces pasteurianus Ep9510]|uniref:Uncharacterized protein n=1 Tax=Emergomyces pasteurianus Ep9510 TaxID=1447872 RepID=A0A1J9PV55_9EURO|nr:hypothetical protein AJ78_00269 [Emergomyces pasteurianus Ep9510]
MAASELKSLKDVVSTAMFWAGWLSAVTFSGHFQRAPTRIGRGAIGFSVGGSATHAVSRRGLDLVNGRTNLVYVIFEYPLDTVVTNM